MKEKLFSPPKQDPCDLQTEKEKRHFLLQESMMYIHASQVIAYIDARQAYAKFDKAEWDQLNHSRSTMQRLISTLKRLNGLRRKYFCTVLTLNNEGLDRAAVIDGMILKLFNATDEQHTMFDHTSEMIMKGKVPLFLDWEYCDLQEISKQSNYSVETIRGVITWLYRFGESNVIGR